MLTSAKNYARFNFLMSMAGYRFTFKIVELMLEEDEEAVCPAFESSDEGLSGDLVLLHEGDSSCNTEDS